MNHLRCIVGVATGGVEQHGSTTTQVRQLKYEFLCGRGAGNFASELHEQPNDCDRCTVLDSILAANVPPWWLRERPFFDTDGYTLATRFYAFHILRCVEDSPIFSRWEAAHTFERLSTLISGTPLQLGCHFCGGEPARPEQQIAGGTHCAVCGSNEVTWSFGPHEEGCPYPDFACECGARPSFAKEPPMRDANLIVKRLRERGEWPP